MPSIIHSPCLSHAQLQIDSSLIGNTSYARDCRSRLLSQSDYRDHDRTRKQVPFFLEWESTTMTELSTTTSIRDLQLRIWVNPGYPGFFDDYKYLYHAMRDSSLNFFLMMFLPYIQNILEKMKWLRDQLSTSVPGLRSYTTSPRGEVLDAFLHAKNTTYGARVIRRGHAWRTYPNKNRSET